ncbi:MAG TPA: GNAT family N-acetyltransferase [Pedococcus sp.]|nr:GNAT family N-acetyltransferase [Pedococcus sp.]
MTGDAAAGRSAIRYALRPATSADLSQLAAVESAADRVFDPVVDTSLWGEPPSGEARTAEPGFLLVAGDAVVAGDPVVGFAHVLLLDGDDDGPGGARAHLEQLAVHPDHGRRGIGSALVEEVCAQVRDRGFDRVTLRTFADIPWNGRFYARLGFVELVPDPAWMAPMLQAEARIGLPQAGRRVAMVRHLG